MYRSVARLAVFLVVVVASGWLTPAHAAKRVALVIGNSAYEQATPLNNAKNDADALAAVLKRLGFDVIKGIDLNRSQFEGTVRKFARAIRGADVALLFYAGHGLQVNGRNYLAPIDAKLSDEADLEFETVRLETVLTQMERETRINLVFLDACRDNPLARNLARSMGTRSANVGRGLARVETGVGTLIAFATEPGNVALDGKGSNSPFTEALLKHIETPDLDIAKLMRRVRKDVLDTTAGKQVPWSNSSLTGDFVFAAARKIDVEAKPETKPKAVAKPSAGSDATAWIAIQESNSTAVLEAYVKQFPDSIFAAFAKARIEELKKHKKTAAVVPAPPAATATPEAGKLHDRAADLFEAKDYEEAFKLFRQAAEQGHANAMYVLGIMYQKGWGVAKDPREAVRWYSKAADKDHPTAMHNLGVMYAEGNGVTKDPYEAVRWYRKAADKGYVRAMNNLGFMYANGQGVTKDPREAVRWYRKAADKGAARAMHNLGEMYGYGQGVTKDLREAVRWYRKAAEKGYPDAMFSLGVRYERGQGVAKDPQEAVRWYRKAADKGQAGAMYNLAIKYRKGEGVTKDAREAVHWYRKAANKGHAKAMYSLGIIYEHGKGIPKDPREAVRWYRKAAGKGYASAMHNLGNMYESGLGVSRDSSEAARWVVKALEKGDAFAIKEMTGNSQGWSRTFRREVQRLLKEQGVYSGSIDGQFGPGTKRAIEALAKK